MKITKLNSLLILLISLAFFSCKKQTEQYKTPLVSDYLPLKSGNYIIYRTDSTVFPNFGRASEIHSYLEKQVVDSQITDGLGRPSYRMFRFLNDTTGSGPWVPTGTFFITVAGNNVEIIEDNLRVIKLTMPIVAGITWNGNKYLPYKPYSPVYQFSNDNYMNSTTITDWDYSYHNIDTSMMFNNQKINNVLIVNGINQASNLDDTNPADYQSMNYIEDMYAKGIGMVYQNFIMWEYQPNTGGPSGGFKWGFGVQRTMLNHN
ncbi:MAG TPA: hypothetical protein VGO09_07935 [Flavisolibacter sp.]|nr:hypothetical protein [Flavisolibacter sp.]